MIRVIRNIAVLAVSSITFGLPNDGRAADANPPERMTYQGYLVDGNGDPLGNSAPANYDIVFRLYKEKSGSQDAIWAEQQTVTVDKGYFSILLGEGSAYLNEPNGSTGTNLSSVMRGPDISDRYIGLTVDTGSGATEIAPRLRLVSSPFAFTASQAMKLTDNAGNSNFFKDGTSLKLGAGSTPTLTLPEAGGASLAGTLTVGLPGWGTGLQIDNGSSTTTIGAPNPLFFQFSTGLSEFYFNKKITVWGDILSVNTDTILGPYYNRDTYLKISNGSDDKISAYSNAFRVEDEVNNSYLEINPNSTGVQFSTGSGTFQMTKPLTVNGGLTVSGDIMTSGWIGRTAHNNGGLVGSYNNVGSNGSKTNPIYVIGSSYKPAESTLSNMYGVGYADGGASYITGNASGWGMYIASDGDARTFLSAQAAKNSYINRDGGYVGIGTDSPSTTLDVNGTVSAKAYDMTVLTYTHPQNQAITGNGSNLYTQSGVSNNNGVLTWTKAALDKASTTLGTMDKQFKINNPDGAICEINFHWGAAPGSYIIANLIVTTDADGSNNSAKTVKQGIDYGTWTHLSFTHFVKLSQGTHRIVIKHRYSDNGPLVYPNGNQDYFQLQMQVKVNGDADAVSSGWVTEKL